MLQVLKQSFDVPTFKNVPLRHDNQDLSVDVGEHRSQFLLS